MRVAVIGTGYVGLVAGTCFAETGHSVTCVDLNPTIVERLSKGDLTIYEPGLEELVVRNMEEERLSFTTDIEAAVQRSLLVFLCVGTPQGADGQADMSQVHEAARQVGKAMSGYCIIVSKSTCPVGTVDKIREIVQQETTHEFDVVSNPEFLKEGAAVDDFMRPDRVVIGTDDVRVQEIMKELYEPFTRTGNPILCMDIRSSEFTKYACNVMLASRISLMNELATLSEGFGADISLVREGMAMDSRIGPSFLFPGLGFGGSCFPKDVQALASMAEQQQMPAHMVTAIQQVNHEQRVRFVDHVQQHFEGQLSGRKFAIWGASFKPRTDDVRQAPALYVIDRLLEEGCEIAVYDPVAGPNLRQHYGDKITIAGRNYDALDGADALLVCTEWNEFRRPDFEAVAARLKAPVVFDGRNIYNPRMMRRQGFTYYSIGRPAVIA